MNTTSPDTLATSKALRHELLQLARQEDDLACTEGAAVPYWASCPPTGPRQPPCAPPRTGSPGGLSQRVPRTGFCREPVLGTTRPAKPVAAPLGPIGARGRPVV
jgi:hypothetical protein